MSQTIDLSLEVIWESYQFSKNKKQNIWIIVVTYEKYISLWVGRVKFTTAKLAKLNIFLYSCPKNCCLYGSLCTAKVCLTDGFLCTSLHQEPKHICSSQHQQPTLQYTWNIRCHRHVVWWVVYTWVPLHRSHPCTEMFHRRSNCRVCSNDLPPR